MKLSIQESLFGLLSVVAMVEGHDRSGAEPLSQHELFHWNEQNMPKQKISNNRDRKLQADSSMAVVVVDGGEVGQGPTFQDDIWTESIVQDVSNIAALGAGRMEIDDAIPVDLSIHVWDVSQTPAVPDRKSVV